MPTLNTDLLEIPTYQLTAFGDGFPSKAAKPKLRMPTTVTSLVAFGDSITFGQQASTNANRWVDIVATALSAGVPLNQGIQGTVLQNSPDSGGGARASNGRDRYVTDVLGSNKKEMIIVAYGFNDARYVGAPSTFNVANYINDYREILRGLIGAGYAQDRICVVSPHWISDTGLNTGSAGFTGQTRQGFEAYVAAAAQIATEFGVYYADSYSAMRDNGGASLIYTDFIHPIDAGHAIIAAAVLAAKRTPVALTSYANVFMFDNFTDSDQTQITSHSGEKSATWRLQTGSAPANAARINSNRLRSLDVSDVYQSTAVPPSSNYTVEAKFDWISTLSLDNVAITGRASSTVNTYYWFGFSRASNGFRLFKTVAGVNTQLGSTYTDAFTSGSRIVKLEMIGSNITGYVDGVAVVSVSDTDISAAGFAGVRLAMTHTPTTGIHIDSIKAY